MEDEPKSDTLKTVAELLDGFTALADQYKSLAKQQILLRQQLSQASSQCDELRSLIPESQRPADNRSKTLGDSSTLNTLSNGSRNLLDWISESQDTTAAEGQVVIASIREAEFAAFKLRERLRSGGSGTSQASEKFPARPSNLSAQRKTSYTPTLEKKTKSISFGDMELDYTVARKPGQLGCPFSAKQQRTSLSGQNSTSKYNLPTPRSSGSGLELMESRCHRPSFNDPIKPKAPTVREPEVIEDESEQGSATGPACPIRFLDQHTPEDVAKYFEEHKHELPSSHAACVKRFEVNGESIKELDAKYGNLVAMIQGLGQKHQPMLPEVPQPSENAILDEDTKSMRKIRKWVSAVSEGPQGQPPEKQETTTRAYSEGVDEDRQPRFDRPLKEIRVGESPSRPWGVPIPLKYQDRTAKSDSAASDAAAELVAPPPPMATTAAATPTRGQPDAFASRPKGKCPFGHGQAAGVNPPASSKSEVLAPPDRKDAVVRPAAKAEVEPPSKHSAKTTGPRIINHNLAFLAKADLLNEGVLENRGTLMIGYDGVTAQQMLVQYSALNRGQTR